MTIVLSLLSKYWKQLLLILLITVLLYQGYNFIYDRGYAASDAVWVEKQKKVEEFRTSQITGIEGFSKTTLEQLLINQEKNAKDLHKIYEEARNKVMTNTDCSPSTDFTSTYNAVVVRGNKK